MHDFTCVLCLLVDYYLSIMTNLVLYQTLFGGNSVQGQAAEYMRKKTMSIKKSSFSEVAESTASMCFRDGIKQQNIRNLLRLKNQ